MDNCVNKKKDGTTMLIRKVVISAVVVMFIFNAHFVNAQEELNIKIGKDTYSSAELKRYVDELLERGNNVEIRRNIEAVFAAAELYEKENVITKAIELYDAALRVNAWNLKYQLRLAKLLEKSNRIEEAFSKAQLVYDYAEKEDLIQEAKSLIVLMGGKIEILPLVNMEDNTEIVLIPLGEISMTVLYELQQVLQEKLRVNISIASTKKDMGKCDRELADKYINDVYIKIKESLPHTAIELILNETKLSEKDLIFEESQKKFIYASFDRGGIYGENSREVFDKTIEQIRNKCQYKTSRLLQELKNEFVSGANNKKGYIAVTSEDIYSEETNFLFGDATLHYGVVSYHRFTADFNSENQNRSRLVKRILKQAVSTLFFILGIQRCSDPRCIRAYPHSLTELDEKGDEICSLCVDKLREKYNHN